MSQPRPIQMYTTDHLPVPGTRIVAAGMLWTRARSVEEGLQHLAQQASHFGAYAIVGLRIVPDATISMPMVTGVKSTAYYLVYGTAVTVG